MHELLQDPTFVLLFWQGVILAANAGILLAGLMLGSE
jgi:hypothetical protein